MASTAKQLPTREEIPEEKTWRLEDIFPSDADWEKEFSQLQEEIPKVEEFKGKLSDSADELYKLFKFDDEISERLGKLYVYTSMRSDQDTANSHYQEMNARAETLLTLAASKSSFIVPEILEMDDEKIEKYLEEKEELQFYKKTLKEITAKRPHILSEKEEALIAEVSEPLSSISQTFGMLNNADLTFPTITNENGEEVDMTHGRYHGFMESSDRRVRKEAFKAMFDTYGKFKNTFASTLTGVVKKHNFSAKIRNYDSARQAALDNNHIPETVYDNLVKAVNEKLPLLHRYQKLRKEALNLDELHMYDIYTPLEQDVDMEISYEKAQEYVLNGLAPLGEDYGNVLKQAFNNRWIDVEENKGKRSGAYSGGAYGTNPYVLMNWQDSIDNVFTLAHELGHSAHSYYTRNYQPYHYGDYSIFIAEVASTTNENLLNDYMLNNLEDEKEKIYLLNHYLETFRGTVFRQTMFAEFEHDIHLRVQNGEALSAEKLTKIYHDLNKKYYGENVVSDEEIGLEWARIPHFYMNYYVYQYATGFSAATALSDQILKEGEPAVERYINYLKAGSSDYPIEVLKKAGVDMTSKEPIIAALDVFEERLNQMEELLKKA